ncbi:MAG: transcriptional repressor [Bacillota bacterium]|uniref:Fur family transcriptional regulator, ferric uptake regulator n=1 Tax=[Clostridium] aminophilum TaxID=1526 RepID=A0A1I0IRT2_9FIRM|nr:transcriptional repressor [[Clostridium] aminophilum]MCR4628033.1 transcriptional repressor [Clostridium sp.]MDT3844310.1 transcriptional repressor [Bacillota bacterium]SET99834.1 Fur family transcriptional regulator, ferric uptake regulator [[Clostridium] aminophilum]
MKVKAQYKTHHREELLNYFRRIPGKHVTAAEISDFFRANGSPMGTATVYRQLEKLVCEGVISKYMIDSQSPACFEYTGEPDLANSSDYLHCKCEKCGALMHIQCDELEALAVHLAEHHHFAINLTRTVFYGVCEKCSAADGKPAEREKEETEA